MKKMFKCIFLYLIICIPYFVKAKETCSIDNYSADIEFSDKIELSNSSNIKITSSFDYKTEYIIENKDIIKIDENGIITPLKEGNTKVDAKIKFNDEKECVNALQIEVIKSNATLKMLNIEEYDLSNIFKSDRYEYFLTLPYKNESINITATPSESDAKITGDGKRFLNVGLNEFKIVVSLNNGVSSTYKINITRNEASNNTKLKDLIVEGYSLEPYFNKDINEYKLNVGEEIDNIIVNAISENELTEVTGGGIIPLATGENKILIKTLAESGEEEHYTIIVNKSKGNNKLKQLEIKDYNIDFNSDIFTYNITVKNNIEKLEIKTETFDNEQVEIIGNKNFKNGLNDVIIKVSGNNLGTTTYKIIVDKLEKDEIIFEENNALLKVLLIMFIVSIIIMIILITIFLKRNYKSKKKILTKCKNKKKRIR